MNRARLALITLGFISGVTAPAFAHHSAQMFNFMKRGELSGVVKEIRVINPHMSLTLAIDGENGATKEIAFEGHSVNNFYRAGWRPNMVKVGDHIKIEFRAPQGRPGWRLRGGLHDRSGAGNRLQDARGLIVLSDPTASSRRSALPRRGPRASPT